MKTPAEVDVTREAIVTFLWDSLDKLAAFVAFVYFANYFSTNSFGIAYTVIGISLIFGSAPNAIAIAIRKRISEDTSDYERFFTFGGTFILIYTAVIGSLALAATELSDTQFEPLLASGICHLLGRTVLFHVERIFDGVGSPGTAAGLDFVDGLATALLRFFLILGYGMGAEGLLYSGAISGLVVGLSAYLWRFGVPLTPPSMSDFQDVRRFSGWSLVSRLSNRILDNAAVVLAGFLFTPTFASYIKAARNLIEPARIPVRSVIESIFVEVSSRIERGKNPAQPIQNGIDVSLVFAIPLTVGAIVIGDQVMITMYGASYAESGYVLAAVAAGFVFDAMTKILTSSLGGGNYPRLIAISSLLTTTIAVPFFVVTLVVGWQNIFLACLVGGYALRTTISLHYLNATIVPLGALSWRLVWDQFVAAVVMGGVVAVILTAISISSWVYLVAVVAVGATMYTVTLLVISREGRRIAGTVLERLHTT